MSEVLGLEHFAVRPDGPTLTLSVATGQAVAVVGRAASGKSRLLRVLAGREKAAQGSILLRGKAILAGEASFSRRTRVQSLAREFDASVDEATEVFSSLGLWEMRHLTLGELSPSQQAAAELFETLIAPADVALVDGQLDVLDPWTLPSVLELMRRRRTQGRTFMVATNRGDVVRECEAVIALKDSQVAFAGTLPDLLRSGPPHSLEVSTDDQPAVRALVAPFRVSITPTESGLLMQAPEGQELAAKLLLEGYGDVKFVVLRPPSVEEALRGII